jgi:hypothetical protein
MKDKLPENQSEILPLKEKFAIDGIYLSEWVFTEFYHLLRGHCCKNGCRHCVYGHKKLPNLT